MTYTDYQKWLHDHERAFLKTQHFFSRRSKYYHQGIQLMDGTLTQGKAKQLIKKLYEIFREN